MNTHTPSHQNQSAQARPNRLRRAILSGVLVILPTTVIGTLVAGSGSARADELPPRPVTPIPINTPVEMPTPHPTALTPNSITHTTITSEAYIELRTTGARPGLYAEVQWQDPQQGWHTVEGWRTTLPIDGTVRWAVYARDFGTGPFRWAVFERQHGKLLAASAAFNLPCCIGEVRTDTLAVQQ